VRAYYEVLNEGNAQAVSSHFTEDAVHYYTRLGPHEGAETIGRYAAFGVEHGDRKNLQDDLLGFDHEGRGYRMLEDWQAPARAVEDGVTDEEAG
jgi:SnoaL-like domain